MSLDIATTVGFISQSPSRQQNFIQIVQVMRLNEGTVCRGLDTVKGTTKTAAPKDRHNRKPLPSPGLKGQWEEKLLPELKDCWSLESGAFRQEM